MSLKERTGAGLMECKKAMNESSGDMEKAIDLLRQWGVAKGATPKSTEMKEGLVAAKISDDAGWFGSLRVGANLNFMNNRKVVGQLEGNQFTIGASFALSPE